MCWDSMVRMAVVTVENITVRTHTNRAERTLFGKPFSLGPLNQIFVARAEGLTPRRYCIRAWTTSQLERKRAIVWEVATLEILLEGMHKQNRSEDALHRVTTRMRLLNLKDHFPAGVVTIHRH